MANNNSGPYRVTGYGLSDSLPNIFPSPIVARRAPTANDLKYQLGQMWIFSTSQLAYVLVQVVSGAATWLLLESSGGAGVFSSLTVTPGPISLTGTTSINTSGAGVTTINTGGTGALNLGNATGNTAVTGALGATTTLTAGTGITSTLGNIVAAAGNVSATLGNVSGVGAVATGDNAGVAATTSLTNVNALVTSGSGTGFVVTPITGTATTASTGFIKLYQGTTAIYIPYWLATA